MRQESSVAQDEVPPEDYDHHQEGLRTGDACKLSFRSQPTEALGQFLEATARAAAVISKLKIMAVSMDVRACRRTNYQTESFDFVYEAKGYSRPSSENANISCNNTLEGAARMEDGKLA